MGEQRLHVGTSGYSYKEWKGAFYPERLPAARMLEFYATRLGAVEINNTFYRLPSPSLLARWKEQVPETFRFAVKATRSITHIKRLAGAESELEALLRATAVLERNLGLFLFQLPPFQKLDLPRLEGFVERLPEGTRAAFEFRHPSWRVDAPRELLRRRGMTIVANDSDDSDPAETSVDLEPLADYAYVRLRRTHYADDELAAWSERLRGLPCKDVFVFFKHEDSAAGALWAQALQRLGTDSPS
jgi:uncharacterized protein YecE (DUF72 family)